MSDLYESFDAGRTLGEALLEPTRIYVKPVLDVMTKVTLKGLAHITGGGLVENIPRVIPEGLCAKLEGKSWPRLAIFDWLQKHGRIEDAEMHRTFNCGIGMALIVDKRESKSTIEAFEAHGVQAYEIGTIVESAAGEPQAVVA